MTTTAIARTPRQDARRAAILSAARDAFFEEGYDAASMSTIAARVGGSKGTLYNYFKSKEELFEALIQEMCAVTSEDVFGQLKDGEPLAEALPRIARLFTGRLMAEEPRRIFQLVVAEAARSPRIGAIFNEAGPARGRKRLGDFLAAAAARGEVSMDDPYTAAEAFFSLCKGHRHFLYTLHLATRPTDAELERDAREAARIFLAAYGTGRAATS